MDAVTWPIISGRQVARSLLGVGGVEGKQKRSQESEIWISLHSTGSWTYLKAVKILTEESFGWPGP